MPSKERTLMQPKSNLVLNDQSFERLKHTLKTNVEVEHLRRDSQLNLPKVLGIKLTNRCNLRCEHCYLWNESGYHQDMDHIEQALDLDVRLVEKLLVETQPVKARLYLWGGEPLFHRQIGEIFELLEKYPRETAICTNAYFI